MSRASVLKAWGEEIVSRHPPPGMGQCRSRWGGGCVAHPPPHLGPPLTSSTFTLDLALVSKKRIPCSFASCGTMGPPRL